MVKKISLLVVAIVIGLSMASFVHAQSVSDLQAQITALLGQITQLQAQIKAQGGGTSNTFCYTFNNNLSVGSSGNDVAALQTALTKEGFTISSSDANSDMFGESTASAVTGFQEKYSSDVLKPFGLNYGTGFAGKGTRAKLNSLYGCGVVTPPVVNPPVVGGITVTSPAFDGDIWYAGSTYKILWNSGMSNNIKVNISLVPSQVLCANSAGATCSTAVVAPYSIATNVDNDGSYEWNIPTTIPSAYSSGYINIQTVDGSASGQSGPLTISLDTVLAPIKVTSPAAGDVWKVGGTYNINWTGQQNSLSSNYKVKISLIPVPTGPTCQPGAICPLYISMPIVKPYIISESADNNGQFSWTVPSDFMGFYVGQEQIIIEQITSDNSYRATSVFGKSGIFTISSGSVISNQSPVISGVSGPTTLNVGQQGTWTVKASEPNNGTLSYSVVWGDEVSPAYVYGSASNSVVVQQSATFTHTYNSSGTFAPKFTVTNSAGLNAQTSVSVAVGQQASSTSITVTSPKEGDVWTVGLQQYSISWNLFTPTSNNIDVYLSDGGHGTGYFKQISSVLIIPNTDSANSTYTSYIPQVVDLPLNPGSMWTVLVCNGPINSSGSNCGKSGHINIVAPHGSINISSPNGGEVWVESPQVTDTTSGGYDTYIKDISWTGVPDYLDVNIVKAYLEKIVNGQYVTVGRIIPLGSRGSITWVVGVVSDPNCVWNSGYYNGIPDTCFNKTIMQVVSPGQYYVRLVDTATNTTSRSTSSFSIVASTPSNQSPVINGFPAIPTNITPGQSVSFSWHATDANNDNLFWSVNWGDGTPVASVACAANSANPPAGTGQGWNYTASHSWAQGGTYKVTATVIDCRGGSDISTFNVIVGIPIQPISQVSFGTAGGVIIYGGSFTNYLVGAYTVNSSASNPLATLNSIDVGLDINNANLSTNSNPTISIHDVTTGLVVGSATVPDINGTKVTVPLQNEAISPGTYKTLYVYANVSNLRTPIDATQNVTAQISAANLKYTSNSVAGSTGSDTVWGSANPVVIVGGTPLSAPTMSLSSGTPFGSYLPVGSKNMGLMQFRLTNNSSEDVKVSGVNSLVINVTDPSLNNALTNIKIYDGSTVAGTFNNIFLFSPNVYSVAFASPIVVPAGATKILQIYGDVQPVSSPTGSITLSISGDSVDATGVMSLKTAVISGSASSPPLTVVTAVGQAPSNVNMANMLDAASVTLQNILNLLK